MLLDVVPYSLESSGLLVLIIMQQLLLGKTEYLNIFPGI